MQTDAQSIVDLPGIQKLRSGKVREVFDLGDTLLFVATDRISAFDVILPDPIPKKGSPLQTLLVLEALKSFLAAERCVYIVACDPRLIQKGFEKKYGAIG